MAIAICNNRNVWKKKITYPFQRLYIIYTLNLVINESLMELWLANVSLAFQVAPAFNKLGPTATGQNMQNIEPGRIFLQILSLADLFNLQNEIYRIYADCLDEYPAKIILPTQ